MFSLDVLHSIASTLYKWFHASHCFNPNQHLAVGEDQCPFLELTEEAHFRLDTDRQLGISHIVQIRGSQDHGCWLGCSWYFIYIYIYKYSWHSFLRPVFLILACNAGKQMESQCNMEPVLSWSEIHKCDFGSRKWKWLPELRLWLQLEVVLSTRFQGRVNGAVLAGALKPDGSHVLWWCGGTFSREDSWLAWHSSKGGRLL